MNPKVNIAISRENKARLDAIGRKGDSYNDIITYLIGNYDDKHNWSNFRSLNSTEQRNVIHKMNDINPDMQFGYGTDKAYYALKECYFDDKKVRIALNAAMDELNY